MNTNHFNSKVIIACDFENKKKLYDFLNLFGKQKLFLKLGYEILYKEGFELIKELKNLGHNVFVDLKLHDIPNTVISGIKNLDFNSFDFLTVHLSCGEKTFELIQKNNFNNKILGVSILTSLEQKDLQNIYDSSLSEFKLEKIVENLVKIAEKHEIFGIVCSVHETLFLRHKFSNLKFVCPGISLKNESNYDQKRSVFYKDLYKYKADFIVVGRAITKNENPIKIYQELCNHFK